MTATSIYPVLLTADVAATATFFERHFNFEQVFASDWYVSLQRDGQELAVLDYSHDTIPPIMRGEATRGLILNIEVDDVDAEYALLVERGLLEALVPIRSEAFGQRHFIVAGPEGVLIDVITPIELEEPYASQFAQ